MCWRLYLARGTKTNLQHRPSREHLCHPRSQNSFCRAVSSFFVRSDFRFAQSAGRRMPAGTLLRSLKLGFAPRTRFNCTAWETAALSRGFASLFLTSDQVHTGAEQISALFFLNSMLPLCSPHPSSGQGLTPRHPAFQAVERQLRPGVSAREETVIPGWIGLRRVTLP